MRISQRLPLTLTLERWRELLDDPAAMASLTPGCQGLERLGAGQVRFQLSLPRWTGCRLEVELEQRWLGPDRLEVKALAQGAIGTVSARGVLGWTQEALEVEGQASLGGSLASVGQRVLEPLAHQWLLGLVRALGRRHPFNQQASNMTVVVPDNRGSVKRLADPAIGNP